MLKQIVEFYKQLRLAKALDLIIRASTIAGPVSAEQVLEAFLNPKLSYSQEIQQQGQNTRIPFSARQEYIDQLVMSEPCEYAQNTLYDSSGKLLQDELISDIPKTLNGTRSLKKIVEGYRNDPRFSNFSGEERDMKIRTYIVSEEGKRELEKILRTVAIFSSYSSLHNKKAETTIHFEDFGKKIKSNIYIFDRMFEPFTIDGILYFHTEETLKSFLKHECKHAEDMYYGIFLDSDLKIDSSNFFDVSKNVTVFVLQSRGYQEGYAYSKKRWGKYHPTTKLSFLLYNMQIGGGEKIFESGKLTAYEKKLVTHQMHANEQFLSKN